MIKLKIHLYKLNSTVYNCLYFTKHTEYGGKYDQTQYCTLQLGKISHHYNSMLGPFKITPIEERESMCPVDN